MVCFHAVKDLEGSQISFCNKSYVARRYQHVMNQII